MQTHIFVNIWIELQSLKLPKPVHLLSPEFPKITPWNLFQIPYNVSGV